MEENKQGYDPSEFEDDDYMTPQPDAGKSIRGYRIVIIILSVILVALSALYFSIHRQQMIDNRLLQSDRDSIQNDLGRLMTDFDNLQVTNDSISAGLTIERDRADSLMTRLKKERSWNLAKIKQYEKEVGTLRTIMKGYVKQIDSLNTLNKKLIKENVGFRKEISSAKLRADITTRLAQEVRAHPGDLHLRSQQLLLQRASIGTVDAFCLHFVQQNFSALDVPPDFTIADDATLVRLQQETLSTVLEQAYTDPDFCAFADLYDRGRTDDTTGRAVQELYHFTRCHTRRRRCSALLKCGRAMPHRKRPSGGRPFCGKPLRGSRAYCAFCARRKKLQRRTRRRIKP